MNTYIRAELCHWHCGKIRVTSIQAKWTVNTITVELSTSKLSMGFKQWQSNSLLKRRIKSCWFQKSLNSAKILQFWVVGIIVWIRLLLSISSELPTRKMTLTYGRGLPGTSKKKSIKLLRCALKAWKASIPWRELKKSHHFSIWSKQPNQFFWTLKELSVSLTRFSSLHYPLFLYFLSYSQGFFLSLPFWTVLNTTFIYI